VTVVLAVPGNEDHATKLATRLSTAAITPEVRWFPDGEIYIRIDEDLSGHDAVIVGSLYPAPAEKFLMTSFLAATARDLGARRVGLVAPYLAFMRQDVQFKPGEGITSAYFGRLVSRAVDWMVTVDPHLHRRTSLDEVYTIPTRIARAAPEIAKWVAAQVDMPIVVGPDAESVQWVAAVADACGAPYVVLEKTRRGDRDVSITAPTAEKIAGRTPVLVDDIVSTGQTMIEATRQLVAAGSAPPMCVAIHAVFADDVIEGLTAAGAAGIVTCNTIAHMTNRICVADPIAEAARALLAG
jgi:ribose-phosphate pyrophosphokinase